MGIKPYKGKCGDTMISATDAAKFFLDLDKDHVLFNKDIVERNQRKFYEGNARLNKYLHLAQNIYIAKTGKKLFEEDFFAYDNGAVIPEVQENYALLLAQKSGSPDFPESIKEFLKKVFVCFKNASLDELIQLSHEDNEWENKHRFYKKQDQRMDSLRCYEEYLKQYADIIKVLDRMTV